MFTKIKNIIREDAVYLIVGILACASVFYFVIFWPAGGPSRSASAVVNILQEKEKWSEKIERYGPEKAYAEFKREFSPMRYDQQHAIAHLFGTLLYEHEDAKGVGICDGSFGFGCFHGFFSEILSDKGKEILSELDRACVEKMGPGNTGCQHGLGHGLLEYYGHTLEGLNYALDGCGETTSIANKFGCTSGAFMEFNIPVSLGISTIALQNRKFDPQEPYFPCPNVPEKFRESCYFELGQWWEQVLNRDYAALGGLCQKVKDDISREACYLGIGHVLAPTHLYDVDASIAACQSIVDAEGELLCLSGATWQIFAEPRTRHKTREICETLPKGLVEKCIDKADLIGNHGQTFQGI